MDCFPPPPTLQYSGSRLLPLRPVLVEGIGGQLLHLVVPQVQGEVDDVLEHGDEAGGEALEIGVLDCQEQFVALNSLESVESDASEGAADLELLQLRAEGSKYLVGQHLYTDGKTKKLTLPSLRPMKRHAWFMSYPIWLQNPR